MQNSVSNSPNGGSNNSIGMLEHHLHSVFAAVRVPGEDFVYSPSIDYFNALEVNIVQNKNSLIIFRLIELLIKLI